MKNYKLVNFKKEHGFDMPIIRQLSNEECHNVYEKLFGILKVKSIDEYYKELASKYTCLNESDANVSIDFNEIFRKMQIKVPDSVCVIYDEKTMDVISFDSLNKYFDDIWYPVADDIEIINSSCQWILVIRHWGGIYYYKYF